MKIFVAFGYRPEDAWIKTMVFPIIEAFGSSVVSGEELWGRNMVDEITDRIRTSDALIAFVTRRDAMNTGLYNSHTWVANEIGAAHQSRLRILEVRDVKVDPQFGMNLALQRISYDPEKRDECLVEIVRALGFWHNEMQVEPLLLPEELARIIWRFREAANFKCTYVIRRDNRLLPEAAGETLRQTGGMYIVLKNVRRGDLVMVRVVAGGEVWESPFSSIHHTQIRLEKME
jgi:hypothetical protein